MNRTEVGQAGAVARWGQVRPFEERFWAKVDRRGPDECWPWTAYRNQLGYGSFTLVRDGLKRARPAHRLAYELAAGPIPAGMEVMHRCDNPSCVNPAHLEIGTHAENLRDASVRGLFHVKVSDETVVELRVRVAAGETVASAAADLGIRYDTAKRIVKGWLRPHVGGPLTRPRQRPVGTVR